MTASHSGQPVHTSLESIERPSRSIASGGMFGSDILAETLHALDIPYVALNPGASFRGLHDSLVNHLGNTAPQMLLCLHEEHAVAIAQGYAKITGKAMAAAVHSNVGLMHATMAIFNLWCDRMPALVIGATGPLDAVKRRPWIDWIHTARDQGALVRNYVKWDDQPASPIAGRESLVRAKWIAETGPKGPVYINLDASIQEMALDERPAPLDVARLAPSVAALPGKDQIDRIVELIKQARRPLMLVGRVSRSPRHWSLRVALAETFGIKVLTDLKVGAGFPTGHPLHASPPGIFPDDGAREALREADLVLSLDWVDLGGILGVSETTAPVVQISTDHRIHNGWSMDHQALPAVDMFVSADPDAVVEALCEACAVAIGSPPRAEVHATGAAVTGEANGMLTVRELAAEVRRAVNGRKVCLSHLPLSWHGDDWTFDHPLHFVGSDGGGGIGAGPGITVGAALALKDSDWLVVGICGDGDFLMGVTAIWTAVHYRLPMLVVVANNTSFFNDEVHQERVARARDRAVENKWIGQRMADPEVDLAGMARAQGALGLGPVSSSSQLSEALREALGHVEAGGVAVVDVRIATGYAAAMTNALGQSGAHR